MDVFSGESKAWWCKQQYCIETWKVRSMNQGKLDMGKQEMARVNINILGISELQCKGMGEFNSYDHCIYYCGQESLRRNAFNFSPLRIMFAVRLSYIAFIMLRYVPSIPAFWSSSLISKMLMFTLAISCLTTSNLPWLMDLTFQVSMQYCSL